MTKIVITATAVISSAGVGPGPVLAAMASGVSQFNSGKGQAGSTMPWPIAAVQSTDITWPEGKPWVDNKKYSNIAAQGAVAAALQILKKVPPAHEEEEAKRCGTVIAIGCSGSDELNEVILKLAVLAETDPRPLPKLLYDEVPDYSYLRSIPSQAGQFVSLATGFRGSNVSVYGEAGAAGFGALALATRLLQSGELDRVIVVGVSPPLSTVALAAFDREEPLGAEAIPGRGPFDQNRAGTLIGQGAAAIMLEREQEAHTQSVAPMAELLACETICAPARHTALDSAVDLVMAQARQRPGLWWAHGAGSPSADLEECQSVGARINAPATASKGTIGNAFECSGLIDVALAVEALNQEWVPPVGLLQKPDPALGDIDFVFGAPRALPGLGSVLVTTLSPRCNAATAGAALLARYNP